MKYEGDLKHSFAHIQIGDAVVQNTTGAQVERFTQAGLTGFFDELQDSYGTIFDQHQLAGIITSEHHDFDAAGAFGKFAGRLAVRESGLVIIEKRLHHEAADSLLSISLQGALRRSVGNLLHYAR